jgi:hypothetical protein
MSSDGVFDGIADDFFLGYGNSSLFNTRHFGNMPPVQPPLVEPSPVKPLIPRPEKRTLSENKSGSESESDDASFSDERSEKVKRKYTKRVRKKKQLSEVEIEEKLKEELEKLKLKLSKEQQAYEIVPQNSKSAKVLHERIRRAQSRIDAINNVFKIKELTAQIEGLQNDKEVLQTENKDLRSQLRMYEAYQSQSPSPTPVEYASNSDQMAAASRPRVLVKFSKT